jgi:hypothetical protein
MNISACQDGGIYVVEYIMSIHIFSFFARFPGEKFIHTTGMNSKIRKIMYQVYFSLWKIFQKYIVSPAKSMTVGMKISG